jgi:hypothetical protein
MTCTRFGHSRRLLGAVTSPGASLVAARRGALGAHRRHYIPPQQSRPEVVAYSSISPLRYGFGRIPN